LLPTQQYLQMRHEALKNDGVTTLSSTDYDLNGLWDTTRNTDWQKALIGGTAQYTNLSGSVSGGTANTQYLIGGTYHRETTVFPGDFSDQKGGLHFNINSVSADQKFGVQFSGNYLVDNNQLPNIDFTNTAIILAPDAPAMYNKDGTINWAPNASGTASWQNPLSFTYATYQNKTTNLISNAVLSYKILPGLEIKSSFGYTNMQDNETIATPLIYYAPSTRPFVSRTAVYTNSTINSRIIEPQVNYKRRISRGKLDVLIGATALQNNSNGQWLNGSGYNSDAVISDIHSAASVVVNSSIVSVYKYNALFGRINYGWQDKYIVNLTARRDGSSRFGAANQFHNFGSIGAAWIFSEEGFMKNKVSFLTFGKLKGSYGTTGNDQI